MILDLLDFIDIFDFINMRILLISFAIGLYFVYITQSPVKIIFKYNTSEEENNIINSESVECPEDLK